MHLPYGLLKPSLASDFLLLILFFLKHGGTSVTLLENLGAKGVVLVNGKTIEKNANVVLTGGDEVVFSSNGHHAYVSFLILGGVLHSTDVYSQKLETRKK